MLRVIAAPELAEIVDLSLLADAQLVKDTSMLELRAFQQQIQALKNGHTIVNWVEYFRDTEFSGLFEELERDL